MKKKLLTDLCQKWFILLAFTLLLISYSYAQTNHAPVVSNVKVQQRPETRLIDITYDVEDADGDFLEITVILSTDSGKTYSIIPKYLIGDVGKNIRPGKGKKIVWDAKKDMPTAKGSGFKIKITADDKKVANALPSVKLITTFNEWMKGQIKIDAEASDTDGTISSVAFSYSTNKTTWNKIGTITKSPYSVTWDTKTPIPQVALTVWVKALAIDDDGSSREYIIPNSFKVDNEPPTASHNYDDQWKNKDFTINLTATDKNGIGVSSISYKLNDSSKQTISTNGQTPVPVSITKEGTNTLEYWSIDDLGNEETHKTLTNINLDETGPILTDWTQTPADVTENTSGNLRISVKITDSISGLTGKVAQLDYHIGSVAYAGYKNMISKDVSTWYYDISEPSGTWKNYLGDSIFYKIKISDVAGNTIESVEKKELIDLVQQYETITGKDGAPMVLIPAGEFQMGDSVDGINALSVHTVYLDAFYMDVYEVTNAQYKKFMDATGYKAPGYWNDPNYNAQNNPVVGVSWYDAKAYADWAGKRLPTEAEWERSARGGLVGKRYPWGDDITHDNANYDGTGGKDIWIYTSPVGSFAPNGYGLYDMTGNAFEWCADVYEYNYYASSPKSNPTGPESGSNRVLRGGSWGNRVGFGYSGLSVSDRSFDNQTVILSAVGFRCARDFLTNNPPVLGSIGNKTIDEGKQLQFSISATDPENDTLTYSASNLPNGSSFDTSTKTFSWTPGYDQSGSYTVTFKVSDSKAEDIETITITVNNIAQQQEIMGKDGAPMVLIPAGELQMGDAFNEGSSDEKPVHTVYLDAFYIDKFEVTNAQYKKFMDATGHKAPAYWNDPNYNAPNNPVVGVDWNDAKAYADWAGERLPTEAEWEKAARGGLVGKKYPLGDTLTHDDANYWEKGGKDIWTYTSPVGSFAPNGYGLCDMAGNVWEWCADWYDSNYYANSPKSNPTGPSSGLARVLRGGSWNPYGVYYLRVSPRFDIDPAYTSNNVGFRCVSGLSVTP